MHRTNLLEEVRHEGLFVANRRDRDNMRSRQVTQMTSKCTELSKQPEKCNPAIGGPDNGICCCCTRCPKLYFHHYFSYDKLPCTKSTCLMISNALGVGSGKRYLLIEYTDEHWAMEESKPTIKHPNF